jgi:hypothetical protein
MAVMEESMRLVPPTSAAWDSLDSMLVWAMCAATKDDEHAVSVLMQGPET